MVDGLAETTVSIEGIDRPLRFRVHSADDEFISYSILHLHTWEPLETTVVTRLLDPGSLFVDCGANLGWYTVIAAASGAHVIAFEPEPRNLELLRHNLSTNDVGRLVEVRSAGLGDAPGNAWLSLSATNQGDHRVVVLADRQGIEIDITTLDESVTGPPRLLKIDTQGSEVKILRGATRTLDAMMQQPSGLILEFWPFGLETCGSSFGDLLALAQRLVDRGFESFELNESDDRLRSRSLDEFAASAIDGDCTPASQGHTNLLLIHPVLLPRVANLVAAPVV